MTLVIPSERSESRNRPRPGGEDSRSHARSKDVLLATPAVYRSAVPATYYVYILASRSRVLYTGVTNDLVRRLFEHRSGLGSAFARRYSIHRLVHVETARNARDAIAREKQIKRWTRRKKVALIEETNPTWDELSPLPG
jgi:putative endonuclease